MLHFNTLENTPLPVICTIFNEAFSDYIVPIHLTIPLLEQKLQGENIGLAHSLGAFDGRSLVGLILHGTDDWRRPQLLYNGGTGVIPRYRGQRLVQQLYERYIPLFKTQGVEQLLLEVISTNTPAIKAYQHCGFTQSRFFNCYKGQPALQNIREDLTLRQDTLPDWPLLSAFGGQQPSWANSIASIQRESTDTATWLAYQQDTLVGFMSIYRGTKRIRQLSVHPDYRRQGIGSALLQHAVKEYQGPFSFVNITDDNKGLQAFLVKSGFMLTVQQYEMKLMC